MLLIGIAVSMIAGLVGSIVNPKKMEQPYTGILLASAFVILACILAWIIVERKYFMNGIKEFINS